MEMTMKAKVLAGVLMLASGLALAQPGGHGPGHGPGLNIDKLEVLLDLDAYQKQEVEKILTEQREAMRAKREQLRDSKTRPSFEQMKAERDANQKEMRAKLEKVLSPEQLKKLDVLAERPEGQGPRHGKKFPSGKRGAEQGA
jgi:Spy/CpxP family protein refolding chaperone